MTDLIPLRFQRPNPVLPDNHEEIERALVRINEDIIPKWNLTKYLVPAIELDDTTLFVDQENEPTYTLVYAWSKASVEGDSLDHILSHLKARFEPLVLNDGHFGGLSLESIAKEYCRMIGEQLLDAELTQARGENIENMRLRNDFDAVHDFCDANQVVMDAAAKVWGINFTYAFPGLSDRLMDFLTRAMNLARKAHYVADWI